MMTTTNNSLCQPCDYLSYLCAGLPVIASGKEAEPEDPFVWITRDANALGRLIETPKARRTRLAGRQAIQDHAFNITWGKKARMIHDALAYENK